MQAERRAVSRFQSLAVTGQFGGGFREFLLHGRERAEFREAALADGLAAQPHLWQTDILELDQHVQQPALPQIRAAQHEQIRIAARDGGFGIHDIIKIIEQQRQKRRFDGQFIRPPIIPVVKHLEIALFDKIADRLEIAGGVKDFRRLSDLVAIKTRQQHLLNAFDIQLTHHQIRNFQDQLMFRRLAAKRQHAEKIQQRRHERMILDRAHHVFHAKARR